MSQTALKGATIVFDLDGTLVDTAPDLIGALNAVLGEEGLPPLAAARARGLIGRGPRAMLARGFEAAGRPLDETKLGTLFTRFLALYAGRIADKSRPYPGVAPALADLCRQGARLAVCTNKPTALSAALLEALDLNGFFDAVVGPDTAGAAKPDPAHLLAAIERAGGRPDLAVMIGDSGLDAEVARAAGVPLILVDFGYSERPVSDFGPDMVIGDFNAAPAACARLLALCAEAIAPTPATDA